GHPAGHLAPGPCANPTGRHRSRGPRGVGADRGEARLLSPQAAAPMGRAGPTDPHRGHTHRPHGTGFRRCSGRKGNLGPTSPAAPGAEGVGRRSPEVGGGYTAWKVESDGMTRGGGDEGGAASVRALRFPHLAEKHACVTVEEIAEPSRIEREESAARYGIAA